MTTQEDIKLLKKEKVIIETGMKGLRWTMGWVDQDLHDAVGYHEATLLWNYLELLVEQYNETIKELEKGKIK